MRFYRSWRRVEALSFDLDDTLYENKSVIKRAEAWLDQELKTRFVETAHLNAHHWRGYKSRALREHPELIHDVTSCRYAWLIMGLRDAGVADAKAQAHQLTKDFIRVRSDFKIPQHSLDILDRLAGHYPMIAITNGNVDARQVGLLSYFEAVFTPGSGYRRKPFPDLFSLACDSLNMPAGCIAHIGDHPNTDVAGALSSGLRSIWLNHEQRTPVPGRLPDVEVNSLQELEALLCPYGLITSSALPKSPIIRCKTEHQRSTGP